MQVYPQDQSFVVIHDTQKWKLCIVDDSLTLSQNVDSYNENKKLELDYLVKPQITFKKEKIYFAKHLYFVFKNQYLECYFNHKCIHEIYMLSDYELHQKLYPGPYTTLIVTKFQPWPKSVWLLRELEIKPKQYEIEFPTSETLYVKQSLIK